MTRHYRSASMKTTRRQLFTTATAAVGGAVLLAACGDDTSEDASDDTSDDKSDDKSDETGLPPSFIVVQRFPQEPLFVPEVETRLPVSIPEEQGALLAAGPARLDGWIDDSAGGRVAEVVGVLRNDGITAAYWEVRATLAAAGVYTLRFDGDNGSGASFQVFDPAQVQSPVTGTALAPFDTPTVDDHRGVEPYCSRTEPCPFHEMTLTAALESGKPVIYLVGTPAHCTTGTCGPGLDFLIDEGERVGDAVVIVHADVYADDQATLVAPAVTALGVGYEPIIYFCSADNTIVDRLDGVWDRGELRERVERLTVS
jgi:hypothetical protein